MRYQSVVSIEIQLIYLFFSIPNGKPSSITKNSQKEATTIDGKDILDESTRSGKIKTKIQIQILFFLKFR